MMKKVILIDGNSLAFRKMPDYDKVSKFVSQSSIDNRDIYVVRNFIKQIFKFKFVIFPMYDVVVTFDEPNKDTFRHQLDGKYKKKNSSKKQKVHKKYIYDQIAEIKKILDKLNIVHYSTNQWEADDVIGMLTKYYEEKNYLITIVSSDKDILQLISKKTRVAYLGTHSKIKIFNNKNIGELTNGLTADEIIPFKILAGDKSDNIKGLGIKRKNGKCLIDYWTTEEATNYIKEYHTIKNMMKNISKIPEPFQSSLKFGKKKVELNRELVTIVVDWKIDKSPTYFKSRQFNFQNLKNVITDLNLTNFIEQKRIQKGISLQKNNKG